MDLTPDALREATFRGALRGYNVDDVDEFVEKVAVGMGEVLDQLRHATERAVAAERRAKQVASTEDAMRRTLAHAQRLAEDVLSEARQEAARITDGAAQAATLARDTALDEGAGERAAAEAALAQAEQARAEAQAERAATRAEVEAERAAAQARLDAMVASAAGSIDADLRAEVQRLHGVRQALQLDVAVLTSWMHEQRDSVRSVLAETLAALDRAEAIDDPPPVSEVDVTVRLAGYPVSPGTAPGPEAPASSVEVPEGRGAPAATGSDDATTPGPAGGDQGPQPQPADPEPASPVSFPDLSDEEFLAELKKAATGGDDSPFGPPERGQPS